jgi:high-affinity iron transporter
VIANYLIGLREGLEAALVVSILIAYLVKTGRRGSLPAVWAGVGIAIGLSLAFGAVLTFTSNSLSFTAQETFGGTMSIIAVGLVTWMVFWMRRASRSFAGDLRTKVDDALTMGTTALIVVAFISVGREGLETALFIWSAVQASGDTTAPLLGAALGLATAVLLAWLLYKRAVTLNLATFFRWTGAALIIVAAGVLAYGVHDLQEAGILPGLNTLAFDVSNQIPPSSWYGSLLKGIFNFSPETTVLQAIAWLAYVVPVMVLYFRPMKPASVATESVATESVEPASPTTIAAETPATPHSA